MKKRFGLSIIAILITASAWAGSWKLNYDPNGIVSMWLTKSRGVDKLNIRVLPATGDRFAGFAYLKIDGVVVARVEGAPYDWDIIISEGGTISAWRPEKNPNFQKGARDIVLNERFFQGKHLIEVYFVTVDDRNKTDRNKSDAPGQIFELRPIQASSDITLSDGQLKDGHRQAYEQGVADARSSFEKEREEMMRLLNEQSARTANAEKEKIAPTPTKRTLRVTLPESFNPIVHQMKGKIFIAYKLDGDQRNEIGKLRVVSIDPRTRRTVLEGLVDPNVPDSKIRLTLLKETK